MYLCTTCHHDSNSLPNDKHIIYGELLDCMGPLFLYPIPACMIYGIGIEWGTAGEVGGVVSHGNGRQVFTPFLKQRV